MTATTLDPQAPDTQPDPPKRRVRPWMIVTAGSLAALILAGGMYGAAAMGSKTAAAPKVASSSLSPLTITQGPPAGVAAPAAAAKPVPVPTVTVTAQAAVPAAAPAAPVAPAPAFTDASAVVDQYYADITAQSYWAAWLLGGDNIGGGSYSGWVAGFDATESITLGTFSDWGASQVQVTLSALQDDGSASTYVGTYTVAGGVIVAASIVQELGLRQAAKESTCSRSIGWWPLQDPRQQRRRAEIMTTADRLQKRHESLIAEQAERIQEHAGYVMERIEAGRADSVGMYAEDIAASAQRIRLSVRCA